MNTSRRSFLSSSLFASSTVALAGSRLLAADAPATAQPEKSKRPPPLDPELVGTMVRVAHFDLAQVTALLAQEPQLANATWDWGAGDWETPLEAASHIGNRDIARFLLAHGARHSLFAAAMLGERATVLAAVAAQPGIVNTRGPHGFTLLYHVARSADLAMAEAIKPHLTDPARDFNQALQAAAREGHAEMTTWLLAHGVTDPNTRDFAGKTPLTLARAGEFTAVADVLRARGGTE